jgi:hypothetical protein
MPLLCHLRATPGTKALLALRSPTVAGVLGEPQRKFLSGSGVPGYGGSSKLVGVRRLGTAAMRPPDVAIGQSRRVQGRHPVGLREAAVPPLPPLTSKTRDVLVWSDANGVHETLTAHRSSCSFDDYQGLRQEHGERQSSRRPVPLGV